MGDLGEGRNGEFRRGSRRSGADRRECMRTTTRSAATLLRAAFARLRDAHTGSTALSAAKIAAVGAVLNGLDVATQNICGADKPFQM